MKRFERTKAEIDIEVEAKMVTYSVNNIKKMEKKRGKFEEKLK